MPLSVGARLGPYEILALIGAGGMSEVYRARDLRRLEVTGEAVPVAEEVGKNSSFGLFSASANDVLVYRAAGGGVAEMAWFDRLGKNLGTVGEPGSFIGS